MCDHAVRCQPVRTLAGHTDRVAALAFSPDGAVLFSGGWDKMVRAWRTDSAEVRGRPLPHRTAGSSTCTAHQVLYSIVGKGAVNGLALSDDGATLCVAQGDDTAVVRRAADGEVRCRAMGPAWRVHSFSLLGGGGGEQALAVLRGHGGSVLSLGLGTEVHAAGAVALFTGSLDKTLRKWLLNVTPQLDVPGAAAAAAALQWRTSPLVLACAGSAMRAVVCDRDTARLLRQLGAVGE